MNDSHLHRTARLVWAGDDIGLCDGDSVEVRLRDTVKRGEWYVSLETALSAADEIDISGLQRMTSALSLAAKRGALCAEDLETWRNAEKRVLSVIEARFRSTTH